MYKNVQVAIYHREKKGQLECGDSYFFTEVDDTFICALADGLGSGKEARESSEAVIDLIKSNVHATDEDIIRKCNHVLKSKRGVVLGILKVNYTSKSFTFSSIGNIGLLVISDNNKITRNIPMRGYLSNFERKLKVMDGKIEPNTNFLLYSDGVLDTELSSTYLLSGEVSEIINTYKSLYDKDRDDDTTLIAIRYIG